jgi:hypothetical protein
VNEGNFGDAMNITIQITSVWLPVCVTLASFAVFCVSAYNESRSAGDFSIPLFTMFSFVAGLTATISCWVYYWIF